MEQEEKQELAEDEVDDGDLRVGCFEFVDRDKYMETDPSVNEIQDPKSDPLFLSSPKDKWIITENDAENDVLNFLANVDLRTSIGNTDIYNEVSDHKRLFGENILPSDLRTQSAANLDGTWQNSASSCENGKSNGCNNCIFIGKSRVHLNQKTTTLFVKKTHCCATCGYRAKYESVIKKHMARHEHEPKYACKECTYKTDFSSEFTAHLARHRGEIFFCCTECNYVTLYPRALEPHIAKVHRGEKKYLCSECSFQTAYRHSLKMHLQMLHNKLN